MSDAPSEAAFELAPCGYAVLDPSGLVLEANAELLRLVGRSREDVVHRRTLPSLVSVGGRIYFDTHLFPILHVEGAVHEVALDLVHADGTRVPVLLNASFDPDPTDPSRSRIRAIVMEARDRRRYEIDLLEAVHAAEAAGRRATELAQTLQQTLIPPTPPQIDGLEVAASYRPAGDGSEVGGDFYDVFEVADQEWVLVIGDVRGKGVEAATVTAFVRHTVRALAVQVHDPAELLHALDRLLAAHPSERFCTLVVARLLREGGDWVVLGSVGGHPLPLLRRPDGTTREVGEPGSLVGVLDEPRFTTFRQVLADDVLLLYTDGVVEARRDGELYGEKRLVDLVADGPPDVHDLSHAVVEAVLEYQRDDAHDDIAVLAVQRSPASSG